MERIVPGLLIAGFWLLLLLKGPIQLFCLIIVIIVLVAADEYVKMADSREMRLPERWFLNFILAAPVIATCLVPNSSALLPLILGSFVALTCYFL